MPIVSLNLSEMAYTVYRGLPKRQKSRILSRWIVASAEKSVQVEELKQELHSAKNVVHIQKQMIDTLRTRMKLIQSKRSGDLLDENGRESSPDEPAEQKG